jgi:UDPglucose 6-dehydrogenase
MDRYKVIAMKSTVPVGTSEKVRDIIARETTQPFDVVSNPEFLKQGAAVDDFLKPDRVVIGTTDNKAAEIMKELYRPFTRTGAPIMVMDTASAELCKYAANAMLATKISFMNELANIAERVGADIEKVRVGIGSDPRIGYGFIYPGTGYGGSCFPKDVKALVRSAHEVNYEPAVLEAVEAVNDRQKHVLVGKIRHVYGESLRGRTFALWGLAFKPNTDDMREAPSLVIVAELLAAGAMVRGYDPVAMHEAQRMLGERPGLQLCASAYEAVRGADALVIATEWQEFRSPDFDRLKAELKQPRIFDGRNLYDPALLARLQIEYHAIGRGVSVHR